MTSSYLEITQQLQEILDDNKIKLSNKLYLQMSDLNQKAYNIQSNNVYKVEYITSKPLHISENYYRTKMCKEKSLVKLPQEDYEKLVESLEENHCQCSNLIVQNIKQQINVRSHEVIGSTLCSECEDCENQSSIQLISEIHLLSIVKD